jgi:hypothetical protein
MPASSKSSRTSRTRPVSQSVTIPAPLAAEVRLAERGIQADLEAKLKLKAAYRRFMDEKEPSAKHDAGEDLVRAIFGTDAIAEDTLL